MRKTIFIYILSFLGLASEGICQANKNLQNEKKCEIKIIGKSYGDSIVLRFAPSIALAWKQSFRTGYIIQRKKVDLNNTNSKENFVSLPNMPIRAWTLEEMKLGLPKDNKFAAIAAQCLYGKEFKLNMQSGINGTVTDKAVELESRYSFALFAADNSPMVAEAIGSRFTDKSVKKGESYLYRIFRSSESASDYYRMDTAYFFINVEKKSELSLPFDFKAEENENLIELSWLKDTLYHTYSGYYIERSDNNGNSFQRRNKMPIISPKPFKAEKEDTRIFYYDSIPVNYKLYKYRIIGINAFGEESQPSEILSVMGRDKTPPSSPQILEAKSWKTDKIMVKWKMPDKKDKDLNGFFIRRGINVNGPYQIINDKMLSKETKEFVDEKPFTDANNYYQIVAVDTANNSSFSLTKMATIIDTIPPSPPNNLIGNINSRGVVNISWNPPKENDVLGYRVLFANSKEHHFIQCSKNLIKDTVYIDTLNLKTLTKSIYYRVIAVDRNYNPSDFSEILKLQKPDVIPPSSPVILNYFIKDSLISIEWIKSSSEDVSKYFLMKRIAGKDWTKADSCSEEKRINPFIDKKIISGNKYQYNIVAADESGLKSESSNTIEISYKKNEIRKIESKYFSLIPIPKENILKLSWEKLSLNEDAELLIYKAVNGSAFQQIASVAKAALFFKDKMLPSNNKYEYMVKAKFKDGTESNFSEIFSYKN